MAQDDNIQQQISLLAFYQDEITYIIECLLLDYTGEAKREVGTLLAKATQEFKLSVAYKSSITVSLNEILVALQSDNYSIDARNELASLRRKIFNTIAILNNGDKKYNYAEPFS